MIAPDKLKHLIGSAGMTIFFGIFFNIWLAVGIALGIGISKELIHDHLLKRGNCEWGDMYANIAGVALGAITLKLLIM
jgi:hypothetical protein